MRRRRTTASRAATCSASSSSSTTSRTSGVTALYLTPIFQSASNHRYHTYDYLAVDPLLGGDEALRELLDAAHARGMRVILDGVFNHTGRGFWPFHHVLETGAASPYRDWFHLDARAPRRRPSRCLDAYPDRPGRRRARARSATRPGGACRRCPSSTSANRRSASTCCGVAEHWLRFGIDGWRLDVPAEIDDAAFWQEFRRRCRAIRPDAYLVGEIWHVAPEWLRGDRFDALMNYPLAEAILGFAGGPPLDMASCAAHHEYGRTSAPLDGAGFARGSASCCGATTRTSSRSSSTSLGSPRRAAAADGPRRRRRGRPAGDAAPGDPPGRAVHLLRRRGRAARRQRSGLPRRLPVGRGPLGARSARLGPGADPPAPIEPALRDGPLRSSAPADPRVAFERGAGARSFVVAVNAGDDPIDARRSGSATRRTVPAATSRRSACPASTPSRRRRSSTAARRSRSARGPVACSAWSERVVPAFSVILPRPVADLPIDLGARARRAPRPRPRCRGEDPADARRTGARRGKRRPVARWRRRDPGPTARRARRAGLVRAGGRTGAASTRPTRRSMSSSGCGRPFRGVDRTTSDRGGPRPAPRRAAPVRPRLRPRRRLAPARRPARVRRAEPARRAVPARRVQGPGRALLLDLSLARRRGDLPGRRRSATSGGPSRRR